jgi:RHS repeat-associated protein
MAPSPSTAAARSLLILPLSEVPLGPVVMADDPCEAAFGCETPSGARKYYRARYYDPSAGRFLGEDPLRLQDGLSLYSYVHNNPANLVDPDGRCVPCAIVAGVVAGLLLFPSPANAPGPKDPTFPSDQGGGTMAGAAAGVVAYEIAEAAALAIVRSAEKTCKVRCNIKLEPADHSFPSMGGKWCWHIRVTCWLAGEPGSTFINVQIPLPWCYETKRGQGGR